jgi:pheromone shutdown protein TraB
MFLIALAAWYIAFFGHIRAICRNLANGYTTAGTAVWSLVNVGVTWAGKMLGFAMTTTVLKDRIMAFLERLFGPSSITAMRFARWTMIVSGLIAVGTIVYHLGRVLSVQQCGEIFILPDWAA